MSSAPGPASEAWPGGPFPQGAHFDGAGTNFAVWSTTATSAALALFDGATETLVPLREQTYGIWHGYLPGVGPGQRYGFRLDGPFDPSRGLFHQPAKLLLDPYARAVEGDFVDDPRAYPTSGEDSAPVVPRSIVTHDTFDWAGDSTPKTAWADTVIYELHVRGFTAQLPGVPDELRGTYAGLGHPGAVDYLRRLGVTAVELLPVHQFVSEPAVQRRGMGNYWGYNSIAFLAPHHQYAAAADPLDAIGEFKAMVRALHAAGIEVILDAVYNHSGEGDEHGPVLSFKGIDNAAYYRSQPADPGRYIDVTGCGNTIDTRQPFVLQLVMDSLRYWVREMHVDGFRFDLAPALARSAGDMDRLSAFFCAVQQDPVVNGVKLIAEPWDIGPNGYQLGRFPGLWAEWNGRYRDTLRGFWAQGAGGVRDLAYRLSGSSDLYGRNGRQPYASINFATAHDGFTMRDLVSYASKHNDANGEGDRDGTDDNRSTNCGAEGPTGDPVIAAARLRRVRGILATLLLSTGVPMLVAGDERWRTQGGNNNAYVSVDGRDDAASWLDWTDSAEAADLTALVTALLAMRRRSPVLRQHGFFDGQPVPGGDGCKDLAWFSADGREFDDAQWFDPGLRTIAMYLDGRGLRQRDPQNELIVDDSYLIVLNAADDQVQATLPGAPWAVSYQLVIDSTQPGGAPAEPSGQPAGQPVTVADHCVWLLRVVH